MPDVAERLDKSAWRAESEAIKCIGDYNIDDAWVWARAAKQLRREAAAMRRTEEKKDSIGIHWQRRTRVRRQKEPAKVLISRGDVFVLTVFLIASVSSISLLYGVALMLGNR